MVTGHSLGGALATLLTLDISLNYPVPPSNPPSLTAFTLASPTVGDPGFAAAFYGQITASAPNTLQIVSYRIANGWDSVPNLPPPTFDDPIGELGGAIGQFYYEPVAGFCPVDGGVTIDESIAHSMNSYVAGLNSVLNPPTANATVSPATHRHLRRLRYAR